MIQTVFNGRHTGRKRSSRREDNIRLNVFKRRESCRVDRVGRKRSVRFPGEKANVIIHLIWRDLWKWVERIPRGHLDRSNMPINCAQPLSQMMNSCQMVRQEFRPHENDVFPVCRILGQWLVSLSLSDSEGAGVDVFSTSLSSSR